MSKLTNLLIPLFLISAGAISCTNQGFVKKKDITDQQFINTINQDGNYEEGLLQPDEENVASQALSSNISIKEGSSPSTNTIIKQTENNAIEKERIDSLPGVEQEQIKLNQVGLAHFALGIAYTERNLIDQAIYEFQCSIEENPNHLESHIQLGTAYGIKGMTDDAKCEFKKAMGIDLNEAVAKMVFNALPVAENTKEQKDLFEAYINLGNAYKKEAKFKKAQLAFEKGLALKPGNTIAKKSLSEIYFSLGTFHLENQEYDNAIIEFNKVSGINPNFPQLKDVLEKAHYNLGIVYAENRKLDKAIIEFNKTMKINQNYAMLDKSTLNIISEDKKVIPDKGIHSSESYSGKNVSGSTNNDVRRKNLHKGEQVKESLKKKIPHKIDVAEEMILAKKSNTKNREDSQKHVDSQYPFLLSQGTNSLKPEKVLMKKVPHKEGRDEKQIQGHVAYKQTEVKQETGASLSNDQANVGVVIQVNSSEEKAVAKNKTNSDYRVYTYNITKNYKTKIEVNDAIKRYEDDTIKNPYDNNAILNLAHAYYRKAMYLDDAIARRENAPEDNQNFSVKRFYLLDDTDNEKISDASSPEQAKPFEKYNTEFPYRLGNMYEEMFHDAIIGYKNTLRINPCSSNALYGLAFSFSVKGSSPGVALKNKNNPKGILFGY
ncbi:MAG: hypothetical protein HON76_11965 [Candidatus Scalindua sp.]|jgi:tetratricopeptide (TPR) repeat protein|nr:hypothetical protein [Candidatus Scalindua sp.]MBT6047004.1 hypothetical protein [Candidatus Scalindua sp.]MBT6230310.1 hypothetical protein [Candidatus Scalindua sp.]MBT6563228.1 hypothetical protein [Candidatus Scalindua sp.]MBT7210661.1 hypothetical protein [Candidatus Scalindua sp.]